jgi:hypothetical protein
MNMHTSYRLLSFPLLVAAALTSNLAAALPNNASGHIDLNSNGLPRLSPDTCYAMNSVTATGSSNIAVNYRLFRDMEPIPVAQAETTWFSADNSTIDFRPGRYQLVGINKTPTRPARVVMTLNCT